MSFRQLPLPSQHTATSAPSPAFAMQRRTPPNVASYATDTGPFSLDRHAGWNRADRSISRTRGFILVRLGFFAGEVEVNSARTFDKSIFLPFVAFYGFASSILGFAVVYRN